MFLTATSNPAIKDNKTVSTAVLLDHLYPWRVEMVNRAFQLQCGTKVLESDFNQGMNLGIGKNQN